MEDLKITGTEVFYYHICKRQLWFFSHFIRMEYSSSLVAAGREYHKKVLEKEDVSEIIVDDTIAIDALREGKDGLYVVELKRRPTFREAQRWQLLYYLWVLRTRKGVKLKGKMEFVETSDYEYIELTEEDEKKIIEILEDIKRIKSLEVPPKIEEKPFCQKCSYYELCYI